MKCFPLWHGVMAARQTVNLFVKVRVLVPERSALR